MLAMLVMGRVLAGDAGRKSRQGHPAGSDGARSKREDEEAGLTMTLSTCTYSVARCDGENGDGRADVAVSGACAGAGPVRVGAVSGGVRLVRHRLGSVWAGSGSGRREDGGTYELVGSSDRRVGGKRMMRSGLRK